MHGTLLKQEIQNGPIRALAHKNETLIRRGPGWLEARALQESIIWMYRNVLLRGLERRVHAVQLAEIKALSEAAEIPVDWCRESLFQPDAMMLLSRLSVLKHVLGDLPMGAALPGCTSGVALPEITRSGRLLAGRNQDYPIVGPWEPETTVMFHEPTEKGQIPHVAVASAGVHTAGLTAMNREGITLVTHAHFGTDVSLQGQPIVEIGSDVIRRARTLDQVIDLVRSKRRIGNWAFVVTSAKEKTGVVIEMSPDRAEVRVPERGILAHSNYFQTSSLQGCERGLCGGYEDDLSARVCGIRAQFEARRGELEPAHISQALGSHWDCLTGQERVFGNTVSVVTTVKSVVFDPEAQRFWISSRGESPMGLGNYIPVDADGFWKKSEEELAGQCETESLPGYLPQDPRLVDAIREYRRAYQAWHMSQEGMGDPEATITHLERTLEIFPDDGHVWIQTGLVCFRMGEFAKSEKHLSAALERKLSDHSRQVVELFLARIWDIQGQRDRALAVYARRPQVKEPKLREAYREGSRRPYRREWAKRVILDLQFPDTLQY